MVREICKALEALEKGRNIPYQSRSRILGRVKKKMKLSGKQVAAARELLGLTQDELAAIAGLEIKTVSRFEGGLTEPHRSSIEKIRTELECRGIEFSNGGGIGVRLNFEKAAEFARLQKQDKNETAR